MSGFGKYNPQQFKSNAANPAGFTSNIGQLLQGANKQMQVAIGGLSEARQGMDAKRIAEELQNNNEKMNPESFTRYIEKLTGGQSQNEHTNNIFDDMLKNKVNQQKQDWDEADATTLYNRQNAQIDKRFGNTMKVQGAINGQFGNMNKSKYMDALLNIPDKKIQKQAMAEAFVNGTLTKQDRIMLDKMGLLAGSRNSTRREKMYKLPSTAVEGFTVPDQRLLNKAYNEGLVVVKPKYNKSGKFMGQKIYDLHGNPVNRTELEKLLNN